MTPRAMIKAFMRGEPLPRPLLMPILFSLGARLENLPLRDFQSNPTKISNAMRQIRGVLKVDGLTCYYDPFLEAEALGCQREWQADGSGKLIPPSFTGLDDLREKLNPPDSVASQGRVPIACEVIQRLKVMLKDEPALAARVTGPLTLAGQLLGKECDQSPLPAEMVEFAAEVTASVSKALLEAGADVILLTENFLPEISSEEAASYNSLLTPIFNVIRFYEALPVFLLTGGSECGASLRALLTSDWDCILCLGLAAAMNAVGELQGRNVGVALPGSIFDSNNLNSKELADSIDGLTAQNHLILLTTAQDAPSNSDVGRITDVLGRFRTLLSSLQAS